MSKFRSLKPVDLIQLLKEHNCELVRSAKHSIWQHPNGTRMTIPNGRKKISPGVYHKVQKFLGIK